MDKQEFLEKFSYQVLQIDTVISEDTNLLDLEAWDSLAQITALVFFDKEFGVKLTFQEIEKIINMTELLGKISF